MRLSTYEVLSLSVYAYKQSKAICMPTNQLCMLQARLCMHAIASTLQRSYKFLFSNVYVFQLAINTLRTNFIAEVQSSLPC